MNQKITVTLTPEEALRFGLMRPISEQEILKPIGKAFMDYAQTQNFGSTSFILTLLQIAYAAGRIEGVRSERNRKRRTYKEIIEEEKIMKNGAYIDIICADYDAAETVESTISATYRPEGMVIRGNELLIPVPENHGMGFSLNQLHSLVSPCRVEMFNLENGEDGETVRWWY